MPSDSPVSSEPEKAGVHGGDEKTVYANEAPVYVVEDQAEENLQEFAETRELKYALILYLPSGGVHLANKIFRRGLHQRHIQMIALAGTIGTGLFLGSGKAISRGGPLGAL
jgi:amino acid transporter